jgi:hypothetical protein
MEEPLVEVEEAGGQGFSSSPQKSSPFAFKRICKERKLTTYWTRNICTM